MTTAIILAGGLGSRLRSVVSDTPKPMALVSGRPFLEYLLDYWIKQGISNFIISVGYKHEKIIEHFGSSYKDATLDYVIEEMPLGTGGGLLLALNKINLDFPFLLLNGDTYFEVDLKTLINFSNINDADWCFSLFHSSELKRYMGMDVSSAGKIISLKVDSNSSQQPVNGGVYMVNPRNLLNMGYAIGDKVSLEDEILPAAISTGQCLFGHSFETTFIDIGIPDDYSRASSILSNN